MKRSFTNYCMLIVALVLMGTSAWAQRNTTDNHVYFLKGKQLFPTNISQVTGLAQIGQDEQFNGRFYRFVQFANMPTVAQHEQLKTAGINLLEYIPNKVYLASISNTVDFSNLASLGIQSLVKVDQAQKSHTRVEERPFPAWTIAGNQVQLTLMYYKDIPHAVVKQRLEQANITILEEKPLTHYIVIEAPITEIDNIINKPYVRYVDLAPEPGEPESDDGRNLHRANAIATEYFSGRHYDGTGVSVAVNDDGYVGPHIDFQGRMNQQEVAGDFIGDHGDMVAGIVGGAGNLDPLMRGMATGSYMHIRQYNASMTGTVPLYTDSAVVVFSTSYSNGCNGGYTAVTQTVDAEVHQNPGLMQVFSAGNSGNSNCGYGAGSGWGNVTGGHKIAKNVIATANLANDDVLEGSSSRGPASDGRIKPDIAAHGANQMSTDPNNVYALGGGTSAAAPGIAGVFAQLNQAYRELNGGAQAPSALLKACMLNSANDLGNDGPDFSYGWGKVNAYKAVTTLEDNRYFSTTVTQGDTNSHVINIPAGVQRAKIMVYWADKEASTSSTYALVNDLDATVTDATSSVHLPWILDPTPNATTLDNPATKGVDNLNNMEQVAIDNPTAGAYTLKVKGTTVAFGPQEYYVVYEFLTDEVMLTYPTGGEGIVEGPNRIHWDAYGSTSGFSIEHSTDSGQTWSSLATATASERFTTVTVPSVVTGKYKLKVTRGAFSDETDTTISVIDIPANLRPTRACVATNAILVAWDSVPNATSYDVFKLGQKYMDYIGTSTSRQFSIPVASISQPIWFSVRARGPEGAVGQRANAVYYDGSGSGGAGCLLSCSSDDDAGIKSLDVGSIYATTGSCSAGNVPFTVTLENMGLNPESNFPIYYQLDNNTPVMETFVGALTPGTSPTYTFVSPPNIPTTPGFHTIKVWTGLSADMTSCNDTIIKTIEVVNAIGTFPYVEDFENGFPPAGTTLENPDNDDTWEPRTTTGITGFTTTTMYINNYSYNAEGELDLFNLPLLEMTNTLSAKLFFDVAHKTYFSSMDSLLIELSTDCGVSYVPVYQKAGASLATGSGSSSTSSWSPSAASDWRTDTVDLTPYLLGNDMMIRFVAVNDYGNNLYIDNINVTKAVITDVETIAKIEGIKVYPNPTTGLFTIELPQNIEKSTVRIFNTAGQIVYNQQNVKDQLIDVDLKQFVGGVYFVQIQTKDQLQTVKLIKE
ncbi:MAG: S8 family serine peptidase [Aureispira sp.]|nr:S8 family serine peptidase [Aureispira sp.]